MNHNKVTPTMFAQSYIKHHCKRNDNGCWEWQRSTDRRGYGTMKHRYLGEEQMYTHRAMWICLNGPIPDGLIVLHSCDNPKCCNVDHLSLGTHKENTADMLAKGRQKSKLNAEQVKKIKKELNEWENPRDITSTNEFGIIGNLGPPLVRLIKKSLYLKIATEYKVSIATIKLIHKGKTWKHI